MDKKTIQAEPAEKTKSYTLEDLEKKWEANKRYDKAHPTRTAIKSVYYFFRYRIWGILDDAKYSVKWGFQRMFRGFDDPSVFSYWHENAKITVKALKSLKKTKSGYPCILLNKKEEKRAELTWDKNCPELDRLYRKRWNDIMDKMIVGWESIIKEDDVHLKTNGKYDHPRSEIKRKQLRQKFDEGMKLYVKYYRNLWD